MPAARLGVPCTRYKHANRAACSVLHRVATLLHRCCAQIGFSPAGHPDLHPSYSRTHSKLVTGSADNKYFANFNVCSGLTSPYADFIFAVVNGDGAFLTNVHEQNGNKVNWGAFAGLNSCWALGPDTCNNPAVYASLISAADGKCATYKSEASSLKMYTEVCGTTEEFCWRTNPGIAPGETQASRRHIWLNMFNMQ